MSIETIRNWDGSLSWKPEAIYRPNAEEQVSALIQQSVQENKRIKIIGSALSWSDIIDVPATAVQLTKMNSVLEVDKESRQIRLQGGVELKDANEALARHGLAFENFGSIVRQTAAGYIATGSHGTGARTSILSATIDKMRLVDGLGEVHELDAQHEPELFSAARVSLGCLGVVTEVTFNCTEAFDLEERLDLVGPVIGNDG
jgi:FAD/FMN-containing dehydrogenase